MTRFGYLPDSVDHRDFQFAPRIVKLPAAVDLSKTGLLSPIRDQGQLGSCTGNSTASALEYAHRASTHTLTSPAYSALALYWAARNIEGTVNEDSGAQIRDVIKAAATGGVLYETEWPYDISKFADTPPFRAQGVENKLLKYQRVAPTAKDIKTAIASGYPVIFGIEVFSGIESEEAAATGYIPYPKRGQSAIGGHCLHATGYDDKTKRFTGPNSWGNWGNHGFFSIDYKYLDNSKLNADNWIVELI